jgi:mRNA interferase RelE/StbE
MTWTINYLESVRKDIKKLDHQTRRQIRNFVDERLSNIDDRRSLGKALTATKEKLWRYRIGSHRIVCQIQDKEITILVVKVGHRSNIYQ